MRPKIKWLNLDETLRKLDQLVDIESQIPIEPIRTQVEQHALLGVDANVYSTEPGAYERTEELKRSIYAKVMSGTLGVEVGATADYASHVEYGSSVNALNQSQLEGAVTGRGKPESPLTLGRSGVRWTLPGPFVLPAAVYGRLLLEKAFVSAVKKVWG
ncbi:HK97 gp10 family phage protein [Deinococcus cellulosilyticus]|uniref:HK97 gp10 family phage protein n=1 Tax=Deinococcus cellulosilyticus (strain DSM 18568 / NBRC 106333 / KACC 11606 / 5516J-15) TaxID=1223518 RepID=A0A511MZ93_DEIC1|nr:HK97 gp10 family phage protein [Deinococcus cellulosilyticus]GEM45914.1 hypothetical protein DC3_15490 [Deinococcus cellulosilyticus NBRC 106333 = KACC 11606]